MIKRLFVAGIFIVLLISMFSIALADNESNDSDRKDAREQFREEKRELKDDFKENMSQLKEQFKERIREHNGTFNFGGKNVTIRELSDEKKEIIVDKINAKTGLNLTIDDIENGSVGSILRAYLSNGRWALVKVMPEVASLKAAEKMRAIDNCMGYSP